MPSLFTEWGIVVKWPLLALLIASLLLATACFRSKPPLPSSIASLPTVPPPAATTPPPYGVGNAPQQRPAATQDNTITTFVPSIARQVSPAVRPDVTINVSKPSDLTTDLRGLDLSKVDLSGSEPLLSLSMFDTDTIWPGKLPNDFFPDQWLQNGLNPGLGIDKLHSQGITGKGVNIAMIGEPILTSHQEIKDNLADYEEFSTISPLADPHATAVASLLVGKTVGIAPEAKLYYFAASMGKTQEDVDAFHLDYDGYRRAFDRIYQINQQLSADDRIKIVVVDGYLEELRIIQTRKETISLYSANWQAMYQSLLKLDLSGVYIMDYNDLRNGGGGWGVFTLSRDPGEDVNDVGNYAISSTLLKAEEAERNIQGANFSEVTQNSVLVPTEHRTLASAYGDKVYTHYAAEPVVYAPPSNPAHLDDGFGQAFYAGLYALCLQWNRDLTPESFGAAARDSYFVRGDLTYLSDEQKKFLRSTKMYSAYSDAEFNAALGITEKLAYDGWEFSGGNYVRREMSISAQVIDPVKLLANYTTK